MIQSRNVALVGLDVFDRPLGGLSTEETKPVGGLGGGVHISLAHRLTASTLSCCESARSRPPL
jgi:hypothetical protein